MNNKKDICKCCKWRTTKSEAAIYCKECSNYIERVVRLKAISYLKQIRISLGVVNRNFKKLGRISKEKKNG